MKNESKINNSASKLMEQQQGNCAQAIFAKYGPQLSLGKVDCDSCMRITSAFGGGINLTGNVCGAITGSLMALGIKYGGNPLEVAKIANQFIDEFKSINGSIICRELVGPKFFDDENLRAEFRVDLFKKCMKYVDDAAHLLEKYTELEGEHS